MPKKNETRILVVDDEPDVLELVVFHLEKENFKVAVADTGDKALKMARSQVPSLLVLDLMLRKLLQLRTNLTWLTPFFWIDFPEKSIPWFVLFPEPKFPVIVELEKQFLERKQKKYPVLAGQTVSVNFVVRNKPVISLITDAVEKALDSLRGIKTDQPWSFKQSLII